ncbi:50S ribosome-binding GTPase [Nostoc sp. FACHB-152]|uniref:GTPase family protein n=1 Tax=unclassified Nostoc TaxID=2593658 RepID=UPI001683B6C2|nr:MULTISPECIES: GTPase [unclassified Nostoc]MBD2447888.1 50S ribosome-binding GTPase [Nostoc sp. FACHB-152]MBD2468538.1 50S ribosome-binding GTPase [Nostoc sp. FACHB-145]
MQPGTLRTDEKIKLVKEEVEKILKEEETKPFIVSVMGQTGVGKSSLLNALFSANLPTSSVRPCTKNIERVTTRNSSGHELWFYDLPGIGESDEADAYYLEQYRQKLLNSDIVLWAIHADSRSVTFDLHALRKILSSFSKSQQVELMSKVTFVLTKVDLLASPPWILSKMGGYGVFVPAKPTRELLEQKASYYQEVFLKPYGQEIVSQTFNDSGFDVNEYPFHYDDYTVRYHGFLDKQTLENLKVRFPKHSNLFDRLYDNYQVIPCSSRFKFNLTQLMLVIVNKLGLNAIKRFKNLFEAKEMNQVSLLEAKNYSNIVVFDSNRRKVIFDLAQVNF